MHTVSRLRVFDALRGFSVASMVAFHLCYDLKFIMGKDLPWFEPPFQDVWRASISWTFLLVAGCMCSFSRNNIRRSLRYGAVALAIFVVTSVAGIDDPISFGVIYCMAACTLIAGLLERANLRPYGLVAAACLFAIFLLTLHVPQGFVGLGTLKIALPRAWYATPLFSWLGLPGPGFISGDYYPLIPYAFIYLCGASLGWYGRDAGFPDCVYAIGCKPLELIGTHALPIYIAHQPILLLLCSIIP